MGTKSDPGQTNIADALFGRVKQRVLAILYGRPDRSFYANEVIHLAKAGTGAVQRELEQLSAAGLITVARQGNQKHYQANRLSPLFFELHGIVIKTSGVVDVLRDALEPLVGDIECAFVYGSMAREEDTTSSDIDLMVVSNSLSHADLFGAIEPASTTLARQINPSVYSIDELADRIASGNAFVTGVLNQSKLWIVGDDSALPA